MGHWGGGGGGGGGGGVSTSCVVRTQLHVYMNWQIADEDGVIWH